MLTQEENFAGLARINRALIGKAEAVGSGYRTILDMDSTEVPVYGEQEQSAYNGYFESTCFHPLLLFNAEGDCLAAKLRPGNVHSADGWEAHTREQLPGVMLHLGYHRPCRLPTGSLVEEPLVLDQGLLARSPLTGRGRSSAMSRSRLSLAGMRRAYFTPRSSSAS